MTIALMFGWQRVIEAFGIVSDRCKEHAGVMPRNGDRGGRVLIYETLLYDTEDAGAHPTADRTASRSGSGWVRPSTRAI